MGDQAGPNSEPRVAMQDVVRFVRQLSHDLRNHLNAAELQAAFVGELAQDAESKTEIKRLRAVLSEAAVALQKLSSTIADVKLTDYKVRVMDSKKGTAAKVRVLIEWSDQGARSAHAKKSWATVGVSENVIEASWKALVDAIRLELMRLTEQDESVERAVEDYCWGV